MCIFRAGATSRIPAQAQAGHLGRAPRGGGVSAAHTSCLRLCPRTGRELQRHSLLSSRLHLPKLSTFNRGQSLKPPVSSTPYTSAGKQKVLKSRRNVSDGKAADSPSSRQRQRRRRSPQRRALPPAPLPPAPARDQSTAPDTRPPLGRRRAGESARPRAPGAILESECGPRRRDLRGGSSWLRGVSYFLDGTGRRTQTAWD